MARPSNVVYMPTVREKIFIPDQPRQRLLVFVVVLPPAEVADVSGADFGCPIQPLVPVHTPEHDRDLFRPLI
jgi:hypothetical protein